MNSHVRQADQELRVCAEVQQPHQKPVKALRPLTLWTLPSSPHDGINGRPRLGRAFVRSD